MFSYIGIFFQMMWCDLPIFLMATSLPQWQTYAGEVTHNLGHFLPISFMLIPGWISNHMPCKVQGEITYPFPNFNGCTVEVWEWICIFYSTLYNDCIYLPMLGLKLTHVCKRSSCTIHRKHNKVWFRCTTCLNDGTWLVGPCFNIKTVFPAIDFYCKDKPIVRQSYLYNGNPYTGKTTPLYWAACWARHIPLFNGLAQVKLSVGQVDFGTLF